MNRIRSDGVEMGIYAVAGTWPESESDKVKLRTVCS